MNKLLVILLTLTSVATFAKDSTWKMCIGDTILYGDPAKLALNVFEHRNSTGDGRVTDLALIYGAHILRGSFDSTEDNTGFVRLREHGSIFLGHVAVDYGTNTVALNGKLKLPESTFVKAVLKCETLGD